MVEKAHRHYGLYRGTVVSNKDPVNQRRLKLLVPAILGDSPTNWAWPLSPSGVLTPAPAVGQGVWVMFENGDPSFPVWLGIFGKPLSKQVDIIELEERVTALEGRVAALEAL